MTSQSRRLPLLPVTRLRTRLLPRLLRRLAVATNAAGTAGAVIVLAVPGSGPGPGDGITAGVTNGLVGPALTLSAARAHSGHRWVGHPGRRLVRHTVRHGETVTGLAVRYHAWTRELLAINHLRRSSTLYAGERVEIPVVLSALPHRHRHRHPVRHRAHHRHAWRRAHASRTEVRHTVVRTARRHHVSPVLALAVAWQESGWQQHLISSAHAVGVMQVLPATGRWMSWYVGRPLNVYGMRDNVTAGVVLIEVLRHEAGPRRAVAAYYQGLGSVRHHGLYRSTRHYVAGVRALRKRLAHGWVP